MLEKYPWLKWSVLSFTLLQWVSVWGVAMYFSDRALDVFNWLIKLSFVINPIFVLVMAFLILTHKAMKRDEKRKGLTYLVIPFLTVFPFVLPEIVPFL
ncbi:hypothetical protein ABID56_002561 [Alkalibacillus flavidus]|uniref:Uncharacterized protein n=1 Tax=Alkalibacillus flavidus TaxID=546021 RepID=A0ABV2KXW4_9BACI